MSCIFRALSQKGVRGRLPGTPPSWLLEGGGGEGLWAVGGRVLNSSVPLGPGGAFRAAGLEGGLRAWMGPVGPPPGSALAKKRKGPQPYIGQALTEPFWSPSGSSASRR